MAVGIDWETEADRILGSAGESTQGQRRATDWNAEADRILGAADVGPAPKAMAPRRLGEAAPIVAARPEPSAPKVSGSIWAAEWPGKWQDYAREMNRQPESLEEALTREETGISTPAKRATADYWLKRVPVLGDLFDIGENVELIASLGRFNAGEPTNRDYELVAHHIIESKREGEKTWLRKVADVATAIPGFGATFLATGGAYTGTKAATTKVVTAALKKAAKGKVGKVVGQMAAAALPRAAGVGAHVLANPQLVGRSATRRMVRDFDLGHDDAGRLKLILGDEGDGFAEAMAKGFGDAFIELGSERSGARILGAIPGLSRVKALKAALVARWLGKPGKTIGALQDTIKRAGWHGVLGEMVEERVGEAARGTTRLEEFPDYFSRDFLNQLSVEAAAFAVPGAGMTAARAVTSRLSQGVAAEGKPTVEPKPEIIPEPTPKEPKRLARKEPSRAVSQQEAERIRADERAQERKGVAEGARREADALEGGERVPGRRHEAGAVPKPPVAEEVEAEAEPVAEPAAPAKPEARDVETLVAAFERLANSGQHHAQSGTVWFDKLKEELGWDQDRFEAAMRQAHFGDWLSTQRGDVGTFTAEERAAEIQFREDMPAQHVATRPSEGMIKRRLAKAKVAGEGVPKPEAPEERPAAKRTLGERKIKPAAEEAAPEAPGGPLTERVAARRRKLGEKPAKAAAPSRVSEEEFNTAIKAAEKAAARRVPGGDYGDLFDPAQEAIMQAREDFDPSKGKWPAFAATAAKWAMDTAQGAGKRTRSMSQAELESLQAPPEGPSRAEAADRAAEAGAAIRQQAANDPELTAALDLLQKKARQVAEEQDVSDTTARRRLQAAEELVASKVEGSAAEAVRGWQETEQKAGLKASTEAPFGKPEGRPVGAAAVVPIPSTGTFGKTMWGFFKRFFTAPGELGQEVYDLRVRRDGEIAREMNKMKFLGADVRRATKRALRGNLMTKADTERINSVLRGEVPDTMLPEVLRAPVKAFRDHIDSLSRVLIQAGVAQGELVGIIQEHMGMYATRSYQVFDDPKWRKHVPEEKRNQAIAFLRQKFPDKTDAEIHGLVESLLYKGIEAGSPVALVKQTMLGSKDLSVFMRRGDIPEPIRELWGEYKDAGVNYMRSIFKMAHLVANHKFLERVREAGLGRFLAEEPIVTENGELIAKIAADQDSVMEPLNGLYTTPEIKAAFERATRPEATPNWLSHYMKVNSFVKYSKTVGSAMTHIRNFGANPWFEIMNGCYRLGKAKESFQTVATGLFNLPSDKFRTLYLEGVEYGLIGEEVRAGELKDSLREATQMDIDEYIYNTNARHASKIVSAGRAGIRVANALYQGEDAVFKAYAWENEKARYREAHPEWTEERVKRHCADIVRDTRPTYSKIGEGIKGLRRVPVVGTFVSFPAEVVRCTFNTLRIATEEMKDPRTRAIGASRYVGSFVALAGPAAISWISMALLGVSPDEDEDLRWFVPPWQENSRFTYLPRGDSDTIKYIDLGYSDPHAWITDSVTAFVRGESLTESVANASAEFLRPFVSEEILLKAIREAKSNQTETGGRVFNPEDTAAEQTKAIIAHVYKALEPGTITSGKRIAKGLSGEVSRTGRVYDPAREAIAVLSGQRIQEVDVEQSLPWRIREYKEAMRDIESIVRQSLGSKGTMTGQQVAADYERMEQLRKIKMSEAQKMLGAAHRLGVSQRRIVSILKAERIPEKERRQLLTGMYSPYTISDQLRERMRLAAPEQYRDRLSGFSQAREKAGQSSP